MTDKDLDTPKLYDVIRQPFAELDESKLGHVGTPIDVEHVQREAAEESEKKSRLHTLQDLCQDHRLFTIGPIIAASRFDRDPVAEYLRRFPPPVPELAPKILDYSEPFFNGLGVHPMPRSTAVVNLDSRLYAVHQDLWERCLETIGSFSAVDPTDGYYAAFPFYELQVPDIPAIKKMTVIDDVPLVTVTVFAVESTVGLFLLQPTVYPRLPYLRQKPVHTDFKQQMQNVKERTGYAD